MPCCDPYPKRCCHVKYTEPTVPDECRCGRRATNGILQVLLSQTFLFTGLCFATATIGDCSLVVLDEPIVVRDDNTTATALGMLSYKDAETDRCYYWTDSATAAVDDTNEIVFGANITNITNVTNNNEEIMFYLNETLGHDWIISLGLCGAALCLGLIIFLHSTSLYCSTQVNGFRVFLGALVGFVMPLLQGLGTGLIHQSQWCDIEGCTIGRSTIFSIVAAICFLLSGIFYWTMENWPGQKILEDMERKRTWMKDPYKSSETKPSTSSRSSRNNNDSHRSGLSGSEKININNNDSNRSSRRTDHTGGTHLRNSRTSFTNEVTSREIDEDSDLSDNSHDFVVDAVPTAPPNNKPLSKLPYNAPRSKQTKQPRSSELNKKKKKGGRDVSDRSESDRYSDEPSPIRHGSRPIYSNRTRPDDSRRSSKDWSSMQGMDMMDRVSSNQISDLTSSEYMDVSVVAPHVKSSHIRFLKNLDDSFVTPSENSSHIRSISKKRDSRVTPYESSTHMSTHSRDDT